MKRLLPFCLLSALFLSACGSSQTDEERDLLEMMNGDDSYSDSTDETVSPEELPYSEGPTEIPADLIPNDQ